jgi:Reverse transcriptase (RNA-dependent DNA polymerase)
MDFLILDEVSWTPRGSQWLSILLASRNIWCAARHGPWISLFLLYINDITSNIQSEIRLFADDCILDRTIVNSTECCILQNDINQLLSWATVWQMQFNAKKCHILSITKQRSKQATTYTLGAEALSHIDSYSYLGVTISSDLRWHNHISCITNKATRTLNFIRRNIYGCSPKAKALA